MSNVYLFLRKSVLEKHHFFERGRGKIDVCDRRKFKLREFEPQNARLPFVPPRFGELETLELEWDTRSIRDKSELLSLFLSQERVKIKKK